MSNRQLEISNKTITTRAEVRVIDAKREKTKTHTQKLATKADYEKWRDDATVFLLSLRGLAAKEEVERRGGSQAAVNALVKILRAQRFEHFEHDFMRTLERKIRRAQSAGQLASLDEGVFSYLVDPSPETLKKWILEELNLEFDPRSEDFGRLVRALSTLNAGANQTVITRAAEKGIQEMLEKDPKLLDEAASNVFSRIAEIIAGVKPGQQAVRIILRIGAGGPNQGIFSRLVKYLGVDDVGKVNGEIIVTVLPQEGKRRIELEKEVKKLMQQRIMIKVKFHTSGTPQSERSDIARLSTFPSTLITPSELSGLAVNQVQNPDNPIELLAQRLSDINAFLAVRIAPIGDPRKSPGAEKLIEKLKQQLGEYGINVYQRAGYVVVIPDLGRLTQVILVEYNALQVQRAAA